MPDGSQQLRLSVHPQVLAAERAISRMRTATGRSLEEWVGVLEEAGPAGGGDRLAWLRSEHLLGSNYARLIVDRAEGRNLERSDSGVYMEVAAGWVESMFTGRRAELRPLFNRLMEITLNLGPDVRVSPRPRVVQVFRRRQFVQVRPDNLQRLDLGLALGSPPASDRLHERRGRSRGDRITHKLRLAQVGQLDGELRRWLATAYHLAG